MAIDPKLLDPEHLRKLPDAMDPWARETAVGYATDWTAGASSERPGYMRVNKQLVTPGNLAREDILNAPGLTFNENEGWLLPKKTFNDILGRYDTGGDLFTRAMGAFAPYAPLTILGLSGLAAAGLSPFGTGAAAAAGTVGAEAAGYEIIPSLTPGAPLPAGTAAATGAVTAAAKSSVLGTLKDVATVISPLVTLIQAASGVKAAREMSRGETVLGVPAPVVPPPVTMPSPASPIVFQAQQSSIVSQLQRRGRASTILTSPEGTRLGS